MPCYHFEVRGEAFVHSGTDLASVAEARVEAVRLAGDLLRDAPETFWTGSGFDLDVCNCDNEVLFTLSLACSDGPPGVRPAAECPATSDG